MPETVFQGTYIYDELSQGGDRHRRDGLRYFFKEHRFKVLDPKVTAKLMNITKRKYVEEEWDLEEYAQDAWISVTEKVVHKLYRRSTHRLLEVMDAK